MELNSGNYYTDTRRWAVNCEIYNFNQGEEMKREANQSAEFAKLLLG